ncbi:hypothetical protein Dcar01_03156 [Deinococcus carri]|uniref:Uncharacterized protein n=1 Tax=Deinococcus carri TaxID=1211323 RepID=A0ABP9WBJ0_9DEIO
MNHWAELVELYEYRVADVLEGRVPRGGRRSLMQLRELLLAASLEPALHRRLTTSDRQYRAHRQREREEATPHHTSPVLAELPPDLPPTPATPAAEAQAWEELRRLAWYADLRGQLRALGETLRAEPEQLSLRVLYAATENADREARGIPALAVPPAGDPLVSLHQPDVTRDLMQTLAERLLPPDGPARFGRALAGVGAVPFPRHADADVLTARLAAAEREPLAPEAREALMRALRAPYPEARDPRERPAIREAARQLQHLLSPLLDAAPTPGLSLPYRSLYAAQTPGAHPSPAVPDDGADELVIHLAGGQEARWRGLHLRWQPTTSAGEAPDWHLWVGEEPFLLRSGLPPAERVRTLATPRLALHLALSGAYLWLQPALPPAEQLGQLAPLARAVARLLDPAADYANLRLARAATQTLRGGTPDTAALGPASTGRYRSAAPAALLALARRGADVLTARLAQLAPQEAEAAFQAAASALNLSPRRARTLHEALHAAAFVREPLPEPQPRPRLLLPDDGTFGSVLLSGEPVPLYFQGRALRVELDNWGQPTVHPPGQPPVPVPDLLVLPFPETQLLLIRRGQWLAAAQATREGN